MKRLVLYYSRADENYFGGQYRFIEIGNTEKVANILADVTGADLFKIEQRVPYASDYNTCIEEAKNDLQKKNRPEIVEIPNVSEYEEIYLGYPNYWGTMPMAVYTVLEALDFTGKTIYPFCTHEGSGMSGTENDIARAAKGAKVEKGLAILGSKVDSAKNMIKGWVK